MDVEFKKRLTGAVLLVLLAVWIIPELLSGPPKATGAAAGAVPAPSTTAAADAATASGASAPSTAPANQVPSALQATAPMASGVNVDPASAAPTLSYTIKLDNNQPKQPTGESRQRDSVAALPSPITSSVPAVAARLPTTAAPPATPGTAASASSAHAGFTVQLGSFALRASADRLVRDLRANGFAAYVSTAAPGGKTLHRVRVGAVTDRASAATLLAQLRSSGMKRIANSAAIVAATSGPVVSSTIPK